MEQQEQQRCVFKGVFPIGDTDPQNLPVASVREAAPFYATVMGFSIAEETGAPHPAARLKRDAVEMVLAENGGDPEQSSCYLSVSDVDQAHAEMEQAGAAPSAVGTQEHGGSPYRVFFVRAPDGLCYCLGQPA